MENSITKYLEDISEYPLLSEKEEHQLADTIFKKSKQKQEARETLMNSNLKLVVNIAKHYQNYFEISLMDLINNGNVGLAKAVDTYNPKKYKTRFSTHAYHYIKYHIFDILYAFSSHVKMPCHIADKSRHYRRIMNGEIKFTDKQLMSTLKISKVGLEKIKQATANVISFDQEISTGGNDSNKSLALKDIIPDTRNNGADHDSELADKNNIIHEEIMKLSPQEQQVIYDLFFIRKTLKQSGDTHKITAEAIRQRKNKAFKKLRRRLAKRLEI